MSSALDRARARRKAQRLAVPRKQQADTGATPNLLEPTAPPPPEGPVWLPPRWVRFLWFFVRGTVERVVKTVLLHVVEEIDDFEDLTAQEDALLREAVPIIGSRIIRELNELMTRK